MNRILISSLVVFAGCVHAPPAAPEPAPQPIATAAPAPAPVVEAAATCASDSQCKAGTLCLSGRCVPITSGLEECAVVRVHFDFNRFVLRPEDEQPLQRIARCLRADQALRVTIEGNADERGTEEYNLALSSQRAGAVERYLEALGVSRRQLDAIAYGDVRPLCTEHDEACWAKNRRVALKPVWTN